MIELESSGDQADEAKVVLFKLDGKEYEVPAKPRVNLALQYLTDVRLSGAFLAELQLLERLAGPDAYAALSNHADLTGEQLGQVSDYAVRLALGALEETPQGNGKSGSKKSRG